VDGIADKDKILKAWDFIEQPGKAAKYVFSENARKGGNLAKPMPTDPVWIGPILVKGFCGLWSATKGIFMENVMLLKV
jgi:hypothetical protein